MKRALLLLLAGSLLPAPAAAAGPSSRTYTLPDKTTLTYTDGSLWKTLGNGPSDFGTFLNDSFSRDNLPWLAAIGASTLLLVKYDQQIYEETKRVGKKLSISSEDKTDTFVAVNGVSVLRGPTDLGSAFYFLGDGWVNIGIFAWLETYGWLKDDLRAARTGHQLAEGLIVTGFTTQVIKRVSGRATPNAADRDGGSWKMFPSFTEFQQHRSGYDAFPSGHAATSMMTVTVLAENYPEKKLIKPVGYALIGLLSFQMVNNGVHWASDYPLGIAVGYGVGKAIARNGRGAARRGAAAEPPSARLLPWYNPYGGAGTALAYGF